MTRPDIEDFKRLCADQSQPWGMADSDVTELCDYALHLETNLRAITMECEMSRRSDMSRSFHIDNIEALAKSAFPPSPWKG